MKNLKTEGGNTITSLENAKKICKAGYNLGHTVLQYDIDKGKAFLACTFYKEDKGYVRFKLDNPFLTSYMPTTPIDNKEFDHVFKGFNVGYMGEGSRGLVEALKAFGLNVEKIAFDKSIKGKGVIQLN